MNPLTLPALDGRDPLGFLATLGVTRLVTRHLDTDARLSFNHHTAQAVLHSRYDTCRQLADDLSTLVADMPSDAAIPGLPGTYPPAKIGTAGSDPVRVHRHHYPQLVATVRANSGDQAVDWLAATATDLGHDTQGRVALTPYTAPSGQQTIRSFFHTPLSLVRSQPTHIHQALTAWRRVTGVTGEYLDHRVLQSRADHPNGQAAAELGVPGATWRHLAGHHGPTTPATHRRRHHHHRHPLATPPQPTTHHDLATLASTTRPTRSPGNHRTPRHQPNHHQRQTHRPHHQLVNAGHFHHRRRPTTLC